MIESIVTITHRPSLLQALPSIYVPINVMKKLHIPNNLPLLLQFSKTEKQIICQPLPIKSNSIEVDEQLADQLGITDQSQLQITYSSDSNKLKLGPVLAILVSKISKSYPPYNKLNPFCEEVIVFARSRHMLCYVTSVEQLLKGTDKISGWTFSKNTWKEEEVPFPQIVYNRIGSRKAEKSEEFKELKAILEKKQVHLFNQTFLDKWEVYHKLSQNRKFITYLPHTELFGPLALKSMIEHYLTIFIKPIHGSLGYGIYRISKTDSGFNTQYSTQTGQIHKQFDRLSQLYSFLSRRVNPKKHIIQEGVPLLQFNDRTIDFRALMQKNKFGKWSITSMVARVGPENRFVSNIARGGEIYKVMKALDMCGFKDPKTKRNQLIYVAKKVCEGIEQCYQDQFGELGVDLGICKLGKTYLLEINSKPSKSDDTITIMGTKGRPSVHRLLDYTQYLSYHSIK